MLFGIPKVAAKALFEKNVASAKEVLQQLPENELTTPWTLKNGDVTYLDNAPN